MLKISYLLSKVLVSMQANIKDAINVIHALIINMINNWLYNYYV